MGRKDRKAVPDKPRDAADYYRLNTKAIDDLVGATPENSPKVSEKELRKYQSGPKIRLKDWLPYCSSGLQHTASLKEAFASGLAGLLSVCAC